MERPTGSSHLTLTMGALNVIGGLSGYLKTGSTASLIAGVGIGSLYFVGGYLINNGRSDLGHKIGFGGAVLLSGAMLPRFFKTRKVWPAGIMGVAGIVSAVYEGKKALEWM